MRSIISSAFLSLNCRRGTALMGTSGYVCLMYKYNLDVLLALISACGSRISVGERMAIFVNSPVYQKLSLIWLMISSGRFISIAAMPTSQEAFPRPSVIAVKKFRCYEDGKWPVCSSGFYPCKVTIHRD